MGKDSTKAKRPQRHDPLHVQLADMPETTTMKKAPRQKFVDRANKAEQEGEVQFRSLCCQNEFINSCYGTIGILGRQIIEENS